MAIRNEDEDSMEWNVRIGTAGWSYPDWDGVVYPAPRPRGFDALAYLSSYFSVIEINSTFYRIPSVSTCRSWARRTPSAFTFTAKVHQEFTHSHRLDDVEAFKRSVSPLADAGKLSAVLVQYPWSFRDSAASRRRINDLTSRLAPLPVALELRHGTWDRSDARRWLEATGLTVCGIDQPVIDDSIGPLRHLPGAAGTYMRLHGRNTRDWFRADAGRDARYDYLYSTEELRPWVDAIRAAVTRSPTTVILNNHFRGQAPANAFELMSEVTGRAVPAPPELRRAFPSLRDRTTDLPETGRTGWLFG